MNTIPNSPAAQGGRGNAVPRVIVATTALLTFISFWKAAAIVLNDLASSAYYAGGEAEGFIGKTAPWFILAIINDTRDWPRLTALLERPDLADDPRFLTNKDRLAHKPELEAELIAYCRAHLAAYKCPRTVEFDPELPRDPNGKLYKRRIRERYWQGRSSRIV